MSAATAPLQPGAARIVLRGEMLELLPERALWWPARSTLAVADLHLGKCASYRASGVPMPEGMVAETLARLHRVVERTNAARVLVLGDLVHSRQGLTPEVDRAFRAFLAETPARVSLVVGNHDRQAGVPPAAWTLEHVGESIDESPFRFVHEPAPRAGIYSIAGHLHPTVALAGGEDRLRLPCFHFGPRIGVLPAFSVFTRGVTMACDVGDQVHVIADGEVVGLAAED